MTHEDKGRYADKHGGQAINPVAAEKIRSLGKNNSISCSAAHQAANALDLSPADIGVQIDLLEFSIIECQVGLFGYQDPRQRLDPSIEISSELDKALESAGGDGKIPCSLSWEIAKKTKIKRLDIGSACEKKQIKIKPCQLGAF